MKINEYIKCVNLPCKDVDKNNNIFPDKDIDTKNIKIMMITEAPPENQMDYFYAAGTPFYLKTTIQAFNDAGAKVSSLQDILDLGAYITTAIKCSKKQYAISPDTMKNCSKLLEKELALFPNIEVYVLMGDVAIKMMNDIWKKQTGIKIIPPGSTYKIRGQAHFYKDKRVLPSYTPAGKNFLIEKSKRKMVAEDIKTALSLLD